MFRNDTLVHASSDMLAEYADTPVGYLTPTLMKHILETHKHYRAVALGNEAPTAVILAIQAHIEDAQKKINDYASGAVKYVEAELLSPEETPQEYERTIKPINRTAPTPNIPAPSTSRVRVRRVRPT